VLLVPERQDFEVEQGVALARVARSVWATTISPFATRPLSDHSRQ
jgi:hypothetical protein